MNQHTLCFVGAGNMAQSLIRGLLEAGTPADKLRVADPLPAQRDKLAAFGVSTFADNNAAAAGTDAVILAVKPQVANEVVSALDLGDAQLLISIAAGIDIRSLSAWTRVTQPIVRCMPNTPALLGAGVTGLFASPACDAGQRKLAGTILNAAGTTAWVASEAQIDTVTAVSGSGPAYFFKLMEAMIDAGTDLGLDRATATTLTIETAMGAARMAREGEDTPAQLRSNVTSPGGTTAAALGVMEDTDFNAIIHKALNAAEQRAGELAIEFGAPTGHKENHA
ncbi:MAG: pyrroline-5-carboxylate reductase [Pseudomonadota bacterium]